MQVHNTNCVNFKSTIRIVSKNSFDSIHQEMLGNENYENIREWEIIPEWFGKPEETSLRNWIGYRRNVVSGGSLGVFSCTGGVVANKGEKAPLMFHIENTRENNNNINLLKDLFKGTNAILVGSKNCYEYSQPNFAKLKKLAENKKIPISFFQNLRSGWGGNFAYFSDSDTLYLAFNNINSRFFRIETLEDLQQICKVVISKADTLDILNPCKDTLLRIVGRNKFEKLLKTMK